MNITLTSYQPFDYTKALAISTQSAWRREDRNWIDVCKKVGTVALNIIAFLPTLLLDLVLMPISFACRSCTASSPENIDPNVQQPEIVRLGRIPTPELVNQIESHPYPAFPYGLTHLEFFRDALRSAFNLLENPKQEEYKLFIAEDNPEQVNIYLWSASSLLVHYLRSKDQSHQVDRLFPNTFPDPLVPLQGQAEEARLLRIQNNANELDVLWNQYRFLTREERASAILQIMVPEIKWQMTRNADNFVKSIHAKALDITQNVEFNVQIYRPLVNDIENI